MSRSRINLFQQFNNALNSPDIFTLHYDKHAAKQSGDYDSSRVSSLQYRANLKDTAHDFCAFLKDGNYGISRVSSITPDMCKKYIEYSIESGNSRRTVEQKISSLSKLGNVINRVYHCNVNFKIDTSKVNIPEHPTKKEYSFSPKDMDRILHEKISPKSLASQSYKFIQFNHMGLLALRVNSCEKLLCKDITVQDNMIRIDIRGDKGGRNRTLEITRENTPRFEEFKDICRELKSGKNHNDRLFKITKDGVNKFLNRRCTALKIRSTDGAVIKSGNHSLRKLCIQERVNHLIEKGTDLNEAAKKICAEFGGHGYNRDDLIETYYYSKQ